MDALTHGEPTKAKKSVLKKIEDQAEELAYLQRKCRELGIPVLIVVEGLSAAGKGTIINQMIQPLDPRGFKVTCIASPSRDEQLRPFLWRFWRRTPFCGTHGDFRSELVPEPAGCPGNQQPWFKGFKKAYSDVRAFERQMRDGGTVILKFFLEVSKKNRPPAWPLCKITRSRLGGYPMRFCKDMRSIKSISKRWKPCLNKPTCRILPGSRLPPRIPTRRL